ncbi:MAG: mtfB 2 [Gemmatimonadetes bacterium]|nr:mtfB 2 [Gemmatimonadota bacterium]
MTAQKPFTILYVLRSLDTGGAERQIIIQARGLAARGHHVTIATFYDGGGLKSFATDSGLNLLQIRKAGRWSVVRFLWNLVRAIRHVNPDVVHGVLVVPNILLAVLKPFLGGARVVWGVRASNMDMSRANWLERLTFHLSRPLAHAADLIIANSSAGREYHVGMGYPTRQMRVILNGIDTSQFAPDLEKGAVVRAQFGLTKDQFVVGIAARLDPMKGLEVALHALALLSATYPHIRLVIVGDGPVDYRQRLQRLSRELGVEDVVVWSPRRDDMPAVFNAFDALCSPSIFGEGFSNSIGEAMACGIPCVVTDIGDAAYIVDGTGSVVPGNNPGSLAAAILSMAASHLSKAKAARDRIIDIASIDQLVTHTELALREVMR